MAFLTRTTGDIFQTKPYLIKQFRIQCLSDKFDPDSVWMTENVGICVSGYCQSAWNKVSWNSTWLLEDVSTLIREASSDPSDWRESLIFIHCPGLLNAIFSGCLNSSSWLQQEGSVPAQSPSLWNLHIHAHWVHAQNMSPWCLESVRNRRRESGCMNCSTL